MKDGPGHPAWNMAVDEAIVQSCRERSSPPTIRFYQWSQPAMTLGYFQQLDLEIKEESCRKDGIPIIRRITGGRAVLHGEDLSYSVSAAAGTPPLQGNLRSAYRAVSHCLQIALQGLGLEVESADSLPYVPSSPRPRSPWCFSTPTGSEILWKGRKIVGSAQRRWKDGMLQQGSMDLHASTTPSRTSSQTDSHPSPLEQDRNGPRIGCLAASPPPPAESLWEALVMGFETGFGIRLHSGELSPMERALAAHLFQTRYTCKAWNLERKTRLLPFPGSQEMEKALSGAERVIDK